MREVTWAEPGRKKGPEWQGHQFEWGTDLYVCVEGEGRWLVDNLEADAVGLGPEGP